MFFNFFSANLLYANEQNEIIKLLTIGFRTAFNSPEKFKNTTIFHLLNYTPDQIRQIGMITPKPASLSVEINSFDSKGFFTDIKVKCSHVRYYNMIIDNVTFEFPSVFLDIKALKAGKIRFLEANVIKLETNVSEKDLLKVFALVARAKKLTRLNLKLQKNKVKMRGKTRRGWFVVEFDLRGSVSIKEGKQILFNCHKLHLNRFPLPRTAINAIFRRINPVFDSDKTWLNLVIDKVKIDKGFVKTNARILPYKPVTKGKKNANK